jgi:hypothetical protein
MAWRARLEPSTDGIMSAADDGIFQCVIRRDKTDTRDAIVERGSPFCVEHAGVTGRKLRAFARAVADIYPWGRQEMIDDQVLFPA